MAAVPALGGEAALSHIAGGALHELRPATSRVDVTVARRARRRAGIAIHQVGALDPRDRTTIDGIPVTSIPRTLLDLAEVLPHAQLQRACERAERLRVLDVAATRELLSRSNGRRGIGVLRRLLASETAPAAEAASELELRFLDLVRASGLAPSQMNVLVEGYLVDAHWPSARLVVELQGFAYHSDRGAFERDHARVARLKLAGYEVLALSWRQVTEEPAWAISAVRALLGRRVLRRRAG
jgi:very-short-patch-repair endonuclease